MEYDVYIIVCRPYLGLPIREGCKGYTLDYIYTVEQGPLIPTKSIEKHFLKKITEIPRHISYDFHGLVKMGNIIMSKSLLPSSTSKMCKKTIN